MKATVEYLSWLDQHRETGYALIRIFLGAALFVRGFMHLADPSTITQLAGAQDVYMWYSYIIGGHLIGGLMLMFGVLTRVAALLQVPILAGAVVFIHLEQGLLTVGQSLELASLVLFLLAIFVLFGSGPISVDQYLATKKVNAQTVGTGA